MQIPIQLQKADDTWILFEFQGQIVSENKDKVQNEIIGHLKSTKIKVHFLKIPSRHVFLMHCRTSTKFVLPIMCSRESEKH